MELWNWKIKKNRIYVKIYYKQLIESMLMSFYFTAKFFFLILRRLDFSLSLVFSKHILNVEPNGIYTFKVSVLKNRKIF